MRALFVLVPYLLAVCFLFVATSLPVERLTEWSTPPTRIERPLKTQKSAPPAAREAHQEVCISL